MKKQIVITALTLTAIINAEYLLKQNTGVTTNDFSQNTESSSIPADEYWNNTVMLLKGDTAGSNLPINQVSSISVNGGVASTDDSYFGDSSLKFTGSGSDYAWTFANSAFALGTEDFTLEAFVKRNVWAENYPRIMVAGTGEWGGPDNWGINFGHAVWGIDKFYFAHSSWNLNAPLLTSQVNIVNGQWYHFAITREGDTFRMFVDGQLQDTENWSGSMSSSSSVILALGGAYGGANHAKLNGFMDEVRVTKGIARYTSNFSVPTQEFGTGE